MFQVSRAAVEGYTGEGEPPCIVMTLRAVSSGRPSNDFSVNVTLTGVRTPANRDAILQIKRPAESK